MDDQFKILLVEDDDNLRESLALLLNKKYTTTPVSNGKQAREILILQDFDLVISDIRMPFLTGIELLEWIKSASKNTKVILCTGFAQILETKNAAELGADDFLTKPFSSNELFEKILKLTSQSKLENAEKNDDRDLDDDFCKVPIEDFISEKNTDYGVYIRISNKKYIKIAHQGGKIAEERCNKFKEKNIYFLYVRKEDFDKLVGFTIFIGNVINQTASITTQKKMRFLKYTGELVLEHIFSIGIDQKAFTEAKSFITSSIDMISKDPNIFNLLESMNQNSDFLYMHSLAVAHLSYLMAREMGYSNSSILFKITMGGLFHDIGKKELPKELLCKPRHQWTAQDNLLYESHVIRGKEILESMSNIPTEVITIAYEHHENNLGQGYPRRLDRKKINPLSQIIIVANIFAEYVVKRGDDIPVLKSNLALQKMEFHKRDYMNEQAFAALKNLIKESNQSIT